MVQRLMSIVFCFLLFQCLACGGSSSNSETYRALFHGDVSNPVVDALIAEGLVVVQDDENPDIAAFDLVIVDGDVHDPATLASEELLIDEAIAANVPVLLVDVTTRHITDGIAAHTGIATDRDHLAYLVSTSRNSVGAPEHTVFGYHTDSQVVDLETTGFESDEPGIQSLEEAETAADTTAAARKEALIRAHAQDILHRLSTSPVTRSILRAAGDDDSKVFSVGQPIEGIIGGKTQRHYFKQYVDVKTKTTDNPVISNETAMTLTAWAYYDPNDSYYKVFVNNDGRAFVSTPSKFSKLFLVGDVNLYQRSIRSTITCSVPEAFVQDSSPKNTNNETEYSDSVSTTIGGSISNEGISVSGEKTVSHSTTRVIKDWGIENTASNSDQGQWNFFQSNRSLKQKYSSLPALSRENLDYSNTSIFIIDPASIGSDRRVTFNVTTEREFAAAGVHFDFGWSLTPVRSEPVSLTITLPTIPE